MALAKKSTLYIFFWYLCTLGCVFGFIRKWNIPSAVWPLPHFSAIHFCHSSSQTTENRSVIFFLLFFLFFFSRLFILIIFISLPRHRYRADDGDDVVVCCLAGGVICWTKAPSIWKVMDKIVFLIHFTIQFTWFNVGMHQENNTLLDWLEMLEIARQLETLGLATIFWIEKSLALQ